MSQANQKNSEHRLLSPVANPENKAFLEAAQKDELLVKYCNACNQAHYYPRTICPHCGSDDTTWVKSAGLGEIYSYTVMRRGVEVPFAMAYVKLQEGISMLTHITNCDFDSIRVGQKVRVVFQETQDGKKTHLFEPI